MSGREDLQTREMFEEGWNYPPLLGWVEAVLYLIDQQDGRSLGPPVGELVMVEHLWCQPHYPQKR